MFVLRTLVLPTTWAKSWCFRARPFLNQGSCRFEKVTLETFQDLFSAPMNLILKKKEKEHLTARVHVEILPLFCIKKLFIMIHGQYFMGKFWPKFAMGNERLDTEQKDFLLQRLKKKVIILIQVIHCTFITFIQDYVVNNDESFSLAANRWLAGLNV